MCYFNKWALIHQHIFDAYPMLNSVLGLGCIDVWNSPLPQGVLGGKWDPINILLFNSQCLPVPISFLAIH